MNISILGTGRMGKAIMRILVPHNQDLLWGTRNPIVLQELITKEGYSNVTATTYTEALKADIIFHTFWYKDILKFAEENKEKLVGKILVDIVNPFNEDFTDFTTEWGTSAAEELQSLLPNTKIVGAFKNTFFEVFNRPLHNGQKSDVFVTSNFPDELNTVIRLLQPTPFRILNGGILRNNRTIERFTLFEREIALKYGNYPYVSTKIFGIEE